MATVMTLMFAVMTLMVMDMTPHVVTVQGGGGGGGYALFGR